ncbi:MAG: DUF58 domain-containing protein [Elainellaceae cyanobacterium]
MKRIQRWAVRLERRWGVPSYSGWILSGLAIFFFGAATNTMAGWLYVISGVTAGLLIVAAALPNRALKGIKVTRQTIAPVMAGNPLSVNVVLTNTTPSSKELLVVGDDVPEAFNMHPTQAIEGLRPQESMTWSYQCPSVNRGIYRWNQIYLRTAAPLGLFWCRRDRSIPARAVVYPQILDLSQCPLLDDVGQDSSIQVFHQHRAQPSTEGLTRALRPYRWGDPTRLIHWRTSARYGELRVRELEVLSSGETVLIALDTASDWTAEAFEQAAIAAASLFTYALRHEMNVTLWTPEFGLVRGVVNVLETLAAVHPQQGDVQTQPPADFSIIWLTQSAERLDLLPSRSHSLLWGDRQSSGSSKASSGVAGSTVLIDDTQELRSQLSAPISLSLR